MSNMVHEASIEDYQDKKLIMDGKPEPRDRMLKINPKETQMFKEPEMRMFKTNRKGTYDRDVNMDHVMDKKPEMNVNVEYEADIQVHQAGETDMYEEAELRIPKTDSKHKNMNVDIIDDAMCNAEYQAGIQV
jgi:ferredoxin-fold anticodon binding domain-containing protein